MSHQNYLIDKYELDYSNIASYSPRPHTVASKMTDDFIDEKTKDERFQILNTKVKEMHLKSNKKFVNKIVEVLVEDNQGNILKGRTGNNKIVHFESDKYKIGDFVNVKIKSASVWHLKGEVI